MKDLWKETINCFAKGNISVAIQKLQSFDQWYGQEEAVLQPEFQKRYQRIRIFVSLQSGNFEEASRLIDLYLSTFPKEEHFRTFIEYLQGMTRLNSGQLELAKQTWTRFAEAYPNLPERYLVLYHLSTLALQNKEIDEAIRFLDSILKPDDGVISPPLLITALAMSTRATLALENNEPLLAYKLFLKSGSFKGNALFQWIRSRYSPFLLCLLSESNEVVEKEVYLTVVSWNRPRQFLINQLDEIILRIENAQWNNSLTNRESHWRLPVVSKTHNLKSHGGKLTAKLPTDDQMRETVLNALSRLKDWWRVRALSAAVIESCDPLLQDSTQGKAYVARINALIELDELKGAESVTHEFLQQYPDHPALPEILFLQANIYAKARQFAKALTHLSRLIETFPDDPSCLLWRYYQGEYNFQAGEFQSCLSNMTELLSVAPKPWKGLIYLTMGKAWERLRDETKAYQAWQKALSLENLSTILKEEIFFSQLKAAVHFSNKEKVTRFSRQYGDFPHSQRHRMDVANLMGDWFFQNQQFKSAIQNYLIVFKADRFEPIDYAANRLNSIYADSEMLSHQENNMRRWLLSADKFGRPPSLRSIEALRQTFPKDILYSFSNTLLNSIEKFSNRREFDSFSQVLEILSSENLNLSQNDLPFWFNPQSAEQIIIPSEDNYLPQPQLSRLYYILSKAALKNGRIHSAQSFCLQCMDTIKSVQMDPLAMAACISTAIELELPECDFLLKEYLKSFPNHSQYAEILFLRASRSFENGHFEEARSDCVEIQNNWRDSTVFDESQLLHANVLAAQGKPAQSMAILDQFLQRQHLATAIIAKGLLLRAELDFDQSNFPRGFLTCQRIITTYPAEKECAENALQMALTFAAKVKDEEQISLFQSLSKAFSIFSNGTPST